MTAENTPSDRIKAMRFEHPEYIPVSVGPLPATWKLRREAIEEIVLRHPICFGEYEKGSRDFDAMGGLYVEGQQVDAWGCEWSNIREGCDSYPTTHPLPRREMVRASTVFQYWFGPSRNVELFRRIPSMRNRVRKPVKPRMKGEPWPCPVFCTIIDGSSASTSGTVRGILRFWM